MIEVFKDVEVEALKLFISFIFNFLFMAEVQLVIISLATAKSGLLHFRSIKEFAWIIRKIVRDLRPPVLAVISATAAFFSVVDVHLLSFDLTKEAVLKEVLFVVISGGISLLIFWLTYLSYRTQAIAVINEDGSIRPLFGNFGSMPESRRIIFEAKKEMGKLRAKGALLIWKKRGPARLACEVILLSDGLEENTWRAEERS